jgi:hypothetical protein
MNTVKGCSSVKTYTEQYKQAVGHLRIWVRTHDVMPKACHERVGPLVRLKDVTQTSLSDVFFGTMLGSKARGPARAVAIKKIRVFNNNLPATRHVSPNFRISCLS